MMYEQLRLWLCSPKAPWELKCRRKGYGVSTLRLRFALATGVGLGLARVTDFDLAILVCGSFWFK